jgi:hypothetical protein
MLTDLTVADVADMGIQPHAYVICTDRELFAADGPWIPHCSAHCGFPDDHPIHSVVDGKAAA